MTKKKVLGVATIEIVGELPYHNDIQDILDWLLMKLAADPPRDWGRGRGGMNYASATVLSIAVSENKQP